MSKLFLGDVNLTGFSAADKAQEIADRVEAIKSKLDSIKNGGVLKVVIAYKSEYNEKGHFLKKITKGEYLLGCDYAKVMEAIGKTPKAQNNCTSLFGNSIIKQHNNTKNTFLSVYNINGGNKPEVIRIIDEEPATKAEWEAIMPPHNSSISNPVVFTPKVENIISIE